MAASSPPAPGSPEERRWLRSAGAVVGVVALASLACTFPSAMRVAAAWPTGPGLGVVWPGLALSAGLPMGAAVLVVHGAAVSLRAFGGPDAEVRAWASGVWLAAIFVSTAMFASVLRATTHQHALAGVTFAMGALALTLGWGLVASRLAAIVRGLSPVSRRGVQATVILLAAGALAMAFARFSRRGPSDASRVCAETIMDVLAFGLCSLLAARAVRRGALAARGLALLGPPLAVALAVAGASSLIDCGFHRVVRDYAPAFGVGLNGLTRLVCGS